VRPVDVVVSHPRIDRSLRRGQGGERGHLVEEVGPQRAVESLHLAVLVRGEGVDQPVLNAVLAADPVEHHLPALAEPVGELLAIVRLHFLRHPEPAQGFGERDADRPSGGPLDHLRHHTEPGMIVHTGDDLGLPRLSGDRVDQPQPADDVDLPQLHRSRPFEPHKRLLGPLPWPRLGQAVSQQDPVDRPLRRHHDPLDRSPEQLHPDPFRPPPRMLPPHLRHGHLNRRRGLVRTRHRTM
jgi:hypothetical protein